MHAMQASKKRKKEPPPKKTETKQETKGWAPEYPEHVSIQHTEFESEGVSSKMGLANFSYSSF